jgi:uncharacterized protein YcfJ
MNRFLKIGAGLSALGLAACVTVPPQGPTYAALPGAGKTYQDFAMDDARCRQIASMQAGSAADNANNSAVASAVVGTVIGAAVGLAVGDSGSAAGIGAGMGLLAGSAAGAGASQSSYQLTQQRYDAIYSQCMYAAGNRVALTGQFGRAYRQAPPPGYAQPFAPVPPPPAATNATNAPPGYEPSASIPPPNAPPPPPR